MIADLLLLAASQVAEPPAPGPSGAPSGLTAEVLPWPHGVRFRWTNGDASAYTRIYRGSTVLEGTANPGVLTIDLGQNEWGNPQDPANFVTFTARHYKNGQESADSNSVNVNIGGDQA